MENGRVGISKRIDKKDEHEIRKFRIVMGLPVFKKTIRPCLKCDKTFESDCHKSNRLCYSCRNINDVN